MNITENRMNQIVVPLVKGEHLVSLKDATVFDSIIGQNEACNKLSFFVKSQSDATPFPSMIFTGSQGLGKSFMAEKVSKALGRRLVEINCGTVDTIENLIYDILLLKIGGNEQVTLFFDESHKLSSEVTTALLTLLNPNKSNENYLTYNNLTIVYDFRNINVIFATTDAHKMFRPLLNRCEEIYFSLYSNDDLFEILKMYLPDIDIVCAKDDVAYACRGRARDAFVLSQTINRYCIMQNSKTFNDEDWAMVKSIFGIHSYGLHTQEVELMKILEKRAPISCNNLAIIMGVNASNIESELELRPRELGLIENGSKGRFLTEDGISYLRTGRINLYSAGC